MEREFWYDSKQAVLYYVSATEPPKTGFEHAQLLKLFDIKGTQAAPVTGVIFSGLAFSECSNGRPGLGCDCCATLTVDGCCEQLARRRRKIVTLSGFVALSVSLTWIPFRSNVTFAGSWSRMGFRAAGTGRCRGRRRFSSRGRRAARSTAACCSGWTATPSCSPATTRCPPSLIYPFSEDGADTRFCGLSTLTSRTTPSSTPGRRPSPRGARQKAHTRSSPRAPARTAPEATSLATHSSTRTSSASS